MVIVFIYFSVVLFLFIFDRSRFLFLSAFALMLVLFCFNYDNADRLVYENRLYGLDSFLNITEPGFTLLMYLFNKLNLDVQYLYFIVGIVYLSTVVYVVRKICPESYTPIGFFMLANFFLDVVQIRATISLILVLLGFYFLITIHDVKKSSIFFLACIACASLFHASSLFFVFFVMVNYYDKRRIFFPIVVCTLILFVIQKSFFLRIGNILSLSDKVADIANSDRYIGSNKNFIVSVLLMIMMFSFYYLYYKYGKFMKFHLITEKMYGIVSCLFLFFPIISFSADFRRLFYAISPITCAVICTWKTPGKLSKISFALLVWALIFFYRSVFLGNYNTVFIPVMEKNIFFDLIKGII